MIYHEIASLALNGWSPTNDHLEVTLLNAALNNNAIDCKIVFFIIHARNIIKDLMFDHIDPRTD